MSKSSRTSTVPETADELELDEKTIRRDIKRGAPHDRRGNKIFIDVPEYEAWRVANNLTGERGRPAITSPDIERARLRKENALAAKYEMQVERERGELLVAEEVRQTLNEMFLVFTNTFVGFAAGITPQLQGHGPAEHQQFIENGIRDIFNDLGKALSDRFGCNTVARTVRPE